jgi:hypothetical protein
LTGTLIATNGGDGLYCFDRSSPLVTGCVIRSNAMHGVELAGASSVSNRNSEAIVIGGEISLNRQFGFRATAFFRPAETHVNARSNWWGTAEPISSRNGDERRADRGAGRRLRQLDAAAKRAANPGTYFNGPIWATRRDRAASPVSVIGHLFVHSNASLVIEPGAEVLFRVTIRCGRRVAGGGRIEQRDRLHQWPARAREETGRGSNSRPPHEPFVPAFERGG